MKEPSFVTITDPHALATYLDRVRPDYPFGIATSLIVTPNTKVAHSAVLIVVSPDGQQPGGPAAELLQGVVTKGLKLAPERCLVSVVSAEDSLQECISRILETSHAPVCVVFGGDQAPGSVDQIAEVRVLYTYGLERIVHESVVKRELWKHLQEHVLPLVQEE
jgi:hypothetical protein